jgi:hypothetical protein
MLQRKNHIKIKLRQYLWMLMACLCVVFSSAVKKVLQLYADQKISTLAHGDNDGFRLISQNIKDGCREKHEVPVLVASDNKVAPVPGFIPSMHIAYLQASPSQLGLYTWASSRISYMGHLAVASGSIPVYLRSRRLQV